MASDGTSTIFYSGQGKIYQNGVEVHSVSSTDKLRSVQFDDRLIFNNGVNRDFFTRDGTVFKEQKAIVEQGEVTAASAAGFTDAEIVNWVTGTDVAVNDIYYNIPLDAYGIITAVLTANIAHTSIQSTVEGLGNASREPQSGDRYEIIDMVEMNIIPTDGQDDNVAVATSGTSINVIAVSGVNFSLTEAREGDFLRNTVRTRVMQITSVSSNLAVTDVSGQISGDSIVFLKSAMPITSYAHVHYSRRYSVDSRDRRKIRISGANISDDMTSDAGTLDAISFSFGTQQPEGNSVVSLSSFQRLFVMAGTKAVLTFSGTNPIGDAADFEPIGLFPQGVVSPDALESIGNDAVFLSPDGLQSIRMASDSSTLNRLNLSEQIRNVLRDLISKVPRSEIIVRHYPKRSWVICKFGSDVYIYNYGSIFTRAGFLERFGTDGSWSIFDGLFSGQTEYFAKSNGDLETVDAAGRTFTFDQGVYSEQGASYETDYQSGWLTTEEPNKFVSRKAGKYIKPVYEASQIITYTITADANYNEIAVDQIIVSSSGQSKAIGQWKIGSDKIGQSGIANQKFPLRWNGEVVRLRFQTDDTKGPDVLNSYTIYSARHGKR